MLNYAPTGQSIQCVVQQLNSYSYVTNNPLNYVDLNGEYKRDIKHGYRGWKGFAHKIQESTFGILRAYNALRKSNYITKQFSNSNIIRSIIFEEQSHGIDDVLFDRLISKGKTVGLGQITVNDTRERYNSYSREELLNPVTNIIDISRRINYLSFSLANLGIDKYNENYVAYIATAYNSEDSIGEVSNYGKRVQSYYNDFKDYGRPIPIDNAIQQKIVDKLFKE
ncbi:hypothetical protein KAU19_00985 [Candidatus Parcubacteria bacterium]|nr:hypothetical protein [Candidatus Parcubacteria bacterium]